MLDYGALKQLWQDNPETFGNRGRCAEAADEMGLVPRTFKESGWIDRFWKKVVNELFKKPTAEAPQAAIYVRNGQGDFWKSEEQASFDEIAAYVGHDIDPQVDALLDVRDQWDRYTRSRFGRALPRFQPTHHRDPGLDYGD